MKARGVAFTATRRAEWEDLEIPDEPSPQQVIVKTIWSAVSAGTETAIYAGTHIGFRTPGARYPKYPYRAGYAATGTVLAVGSEVTGLAPGSVVVYPGKHAEYGAYDVKATPVIALPEGIAPDLAAVASLGTIGLNGIRLAKISLGDTIVVFGAGLIGQFAAQFANLSGGYPVVSVDRIARRLETARACAIPVVIDASQRDAVEAGREISHGRGFDVVVEATGAPQVVAQALELAARYGRVVLLGSPRGRVEIDPYANIHSPGVTVIGAHANTTPGSETVASRWTVRANLQLVVDLLAAGKLVVGPLVSHRWPSTDALSAYEAIVTSPEDHLGVLFEW